MRIGRILALALASSVVFGCGRGGAEAVPAPATPTVTATERTPAAEEPSAEPAPAGEPATPSIGIRADEPPWSSREADLANRRALRAHAAGSYQRSRDGFAEVLRIAPTHDTARFNLACAHARLGDIDAAVRELTTVLERDPVRFLPKLREDPDLAAVRESDPGRALLARAPALERAIEDAWRRGLLAMHGPRAGLWLPAEGHFVPVWHGLGWAVIDLDRRRLAWIHSQWTDARTEADEAYVITSAGFVDLRTGSAVAWTNDAPMAGLSDAQALRSIDPTGEQPRFALSGGWSVIRGRELVAASSQAAPPPRSDERAPPGFELRGNGLVVPGSNEPIELGVGHAASRWHSFAIHPDGIAIAVASERETEPEEIGFETAVSTHRAFVDHVDLRTRRVTRLLVAPGGALVVEHGGDLYVACGDTHRRYRGFAPDAPEDVVPRLLPVFRAP